MEQNYVLKCFLGKEIYKLLKNLSYQDMHQPGIEPGPRAFSYQTSYKVCWEARILPLYDWCLYFKKKHTTLKALHFSI